MKALVLSPQPFFSPRGTPFSVYYRTMIKAELGIEIDLLTYGEGQNVDIPGLRIIRIPHFDFLGRVKVGPSITKILLDGLMLIWTVVLLLGNKYDFVHAHEEAAFICCFLKPIFKFKFVYDMHSRLPQQLTNFQFTSSKLVIFLVKKLEDLCLRFADVVITICPDLAKYVNGVVSNSRPHLLIENSIFEPVKLAEIGSQQKDKRFSYHPFVEEKLLDLPLGKRFVVYAGTLEHYQGIHILIEAFERVVTEISDAFLIIVGGEQRQVQHYSSLADKHQLQGHILFTGRVPQEIAKQYCGVASVLISPRSKGTNTPLKIYEQLASGIPMVATNIYSHTQTLNRDVAFLVNPEPKDMARGIKSALNNKEESRRLSGGARQLFDQKYSREIYKQKIKKMVAYLS